MELSLIIIIELLQHSWSWFHTTCKRMKQQMKDFQGNQAQWQPLWKQSQAWKHQLLFYSTQHSRQGDLTCHCGSGNKTLSFMSGLFSSFGNHRPQFSFVLMLLSQGSQNPSYTCPVLKQQSPCPLLPGRWKGPPFAIATFNTWLEACSTGITASTSKSWEVTLVWLGDPWGFIQ